MRPRQGVRVQVRTGGGQRGWVLLFAGFGLLAVIGVLRGGGDDAPAGSPDAAADRVAPGGLPAPLLGESASGGSPTGQLTITDPPPDVQPVPARPGANGVPALAQEAYQRAERMLAESAPACRLSWTLLAAIGRAESGHAAGGRLDATGHTVGRILGPRLDGSPGLAGVPDTDQGQLDGDAAWDRAVGPMQIVPSIWRRYGADGDGDGSAQPDDLDDAALTAGRYLCAAGTNLTDPANQNAAVLRYRNSPAYAEAVRNWSAEYARAPSAGQPGASGTVPPGASGTMPPGASGTVPPGASGIVPPGVPGAAPPVNPLEEQAAAPRPGAVEPPAPRALPDVPRALPNPPRATPKPPLATPRTRAAVPAPRRSAPSRPTTIRANPSSSDAADQDDTTPAPSTPAPSTSRDSPPGSTPSSTPSSVPSSTPSSTPSSSSDSSNSSSSAPTSPETPTSRPQATPTGDPPTGPKIVMLPSIPQNAPGGGAAETLPTSSVRPTPSSVPLPSSSRRPAGDE